MDLTFKIINVTVIVLFDSQACQLLLFIQTTVRPNKKNRASHRIKSIIL